MNWFDGIVVDEIWVGHSPIWKISGMEGIPYRPSLAAMLKKRVLVSVIFVILAVIPAGLALLIARI